jgi:hypothetical protein
MNLGELHQYLELLIKNGIDPLLPAAVIVEGELKEVSDVLIVTGEYFNDPSPKLSAAGQRNGTVIAMLPVDEDISDPVNSGEFIVTDFTDQHRFEKQTK